MMVEFIGSTGAGKTVLADEVRRRLAAAWGTASVAAIDLVAERVEVPVPAHPTAQNLLEDAVGFPYFLASWPRHRAFTRFASGYLARGFRRAVWNLNRLRNVVRKLGTYEIARRHGAGRIVLVDEGTVLAAHNLFGGVDAVYGAEELESFARLVPLPEAIVYVRAPLELLVRRCMERPDPPRAVRARDRSLVERHLRRAAGVFEDLIACPRIRERALIVDNAAESPEARGLVADDIARFILDRFREGTNPRA